MNVLQDEWIPNESEKVVREMSLADIRDLVRACNGNSGYIERWNNQIWGQIRQRVLSKKGDCADFSNLDLSGINLFSGLLEHADFSGTNLSGANFQGAKVAHANFTKATLAEVRLCGADAHGCFLIGADLTKANLGSTITGSQYRTSTIPGTDLEEADITRATITGANLDGANVTSIKYTRKGLSGKCSGVRISGAYGNAFFRRDVLDQDFIDTLEANSTSLLQKTLFRMWSIIDYGRSIGRTLAGAMLLAVMFGFVFTLFPGTLVYSDQTPDTWFTPFYYSIVTFTTLGFGDVIPRTLCGEIIVTIEVILGYLTLGLLVSILANKVARRA